MKIVWLWCQEQQQPLLCKVLCSSSSAYFCWLRQDQGNDWKGNGEMCNLGTNQYRELKKKMTAMRNNINEYVTQSGNATYSNKMKG